MTKRILQACGLALLVAMVLDEGCTTPPIGYPYAGRSQTLPPLSTDATTLAPEGGEGGSSTLPGLCIPDGVACHSDGDCCKPPCTGFSASTTGSCSTSVGSPLCAPDGVTCEVTADCCDQYCSLAGVCGDTPPPTCVPAGVVCHSTMDCCNPATEGGMGGVTCDAVSGGGSACGGLESGASTPLCAPLDVTCTTKEDCCFGECITNLSLLQVCTVPPT